VTSHPDIDVIVFDILGTMVDEPSGIRRGLLTLRPDVETRGRANSSRCGTGTSMSNSRRFSRAVALTPAAQ
jgi:hypothetical protein